jgi:hypothetical protein
VPDSVAKLVRLRRYRSAAIGPSIRAENGKQDGSVATYVLPNRGFAGQAGRAANKTHSLRKASMVGRSGLEPETR